MKKPNQPDYLKLIPPDKLKEDLDFLFKTIEEVHPNMYAYTSKEEFEPLRGQLYHQINQPMNRLEFYKLVAPVIAELKSAHTFIWPLLEEFKKYVDGGGEFFPLSIRWDGQTATIVGNNGHNTLLIGATILTINESEASEVFSKLSNYLAAEGRSAAPWQLERDEILQPLIWLEYGQAQTLNLRTKDTNGTVKEHLVKLIKSEKLRNDNNELSIKENYLYRDIHKYNTGLIEFNSFRDPQAFQKFLKETFNKVMEQKTVNLIIDLRKNPGGRGELGDYLLAYLTDKPFRQFEEVKIKISSLIYDHIDRISQYLPDKSTDLKIGSIVPLELPLQNTEDNPYRFSGQVFVLIGERSTSASTAFASMVKTMQIGTLVGQKTGDPTSLYGSGIKFELPNSHLILDVASMWILMAGGKNDGTRVSPDYEVKQKPEDTAKGVDTVLEFTLNFIKSGEDKK